MRVLVVAVSARMLAELAVADGHEVIAIDRFGDVDLRAVAIAATAAGNDALVRRAERVDADAVVYGAGFENRPDLVARLAAGRELLGTPPELLSAVRDPWALDAAVGRAGARVPETRRVAEMPSCAGDGAWLRKPLAGGGGRGVRRWGGGRLRPTEILQRRADGLSCSAIAIADGRDATVIGVTEQLHRGGYRWSGNVSPPRLPPSERIELSARLDAVCGAVAQRFGVRGAFGVDAIWDRRKLWVLEVNPRPTASLELFADGAFGAHVRGARGVSLPTPGTPSTSGCAKVKLVLYADRELRAPDPTWWPAGLVRDVPHRGQPIARGAPVCTLVSASAEPDELAALGARLLRELGDRVPAHA
ncbi:MAG TPA: ATP-grasp domain-containing protein [Solirubrobacteraceae bacterium]|nr:ATP-grasp domain-containing protein [Solirubrobacteraceae bacterium]